MSLRNQAARGLKWQAIEIGGRQLLSLVVFTTLARLLDPSAFGLVGLVGVYLAFVGMFVDQGIGTALIQRKELDPGHLDAAFWFNVLCAAVLCIATIALAGPVSRFFHEPKLQPLLQWASLSLVINATAAVQHTVFFRNMDFRRPAIRTLVGNLVGGAVGVVMALTGWGVWSLIGQQLAASLAGAVFLWTASSWRPTFCFSLTRLRELMAVSLSVFSVGFLWFFSSRLDQIVIGRFMGTEVLGQYVVGGKLTDLAKTAIQAPVGAIAMPALSQLQDDHPRMCEAIYKGMELNAIMSFAVFGGLAIVATDLVPLVFGAQWRAAGGLCALLSLYSLVLGLQVFLHPALISSGGPGKYVLLNLMHACGVGMACVVGWNVGVHALVLALIVNLLIVWIPALFFLKHRIGLRPWYYIRPCSVPLAAAIFMGLSAFTVRLAVSGQYPLIRVSAMICSGAAAYVTIVCLLQPSSFLKIRDIVQSSGIFSIPASTGQL